MTSETETGRTYALTAERVHYQWDNSLAPLLRVRSGDRVTFQTRDAGDGAIKPGTTIDQLDLSRPFRGHPLTGPVWVEDAEPGDTLEVAIVGLQTGGHGWTRFSPGRGLLPDDFTTPYLKVWDLGQDPTPLKPGVAVPLEPFLGVMGVAPAEPGAHSTLPPRRNAGNIDTKQLTAGARLYLPVLVPGALFSCGDGHAAQGDGEVCITAIETGLVGTFKLTLRDDMRLAWPMAETPTHMITMAFDPDLDDCVVVALRSMIDLVCARTGIDRYQAYALCSLAADLRITQVVNGNKGVHVMLEKRYLQKPKT